MTRPAVTRIVALTAAAAVACGATVALDDVRSPLWWAAFLLTLILIGAVSWTWAGEVER